MEKEQGNLEAHEVPLITDAMQCKPGASEEVQKQVLKNVSNCFNILSQQTHLVSKLESPEGKQLVAAKTPSCATARDLRAIVGKR